MYVEHPKLICHKWTVVVVFVLAAFLLSSFAIAIEDLHLPLDVMVVFSTSTQWPRQRIKQITRKTGGEALEQIETQKDANHPTPDASQNDAIFWVHYPGLDEARIRKIEDEIRQQ